MYLTAKHSLAGRDGKTAFQETVPFHCSACELEHDYHWGFELPPIKLGQKTKARESPEEADI
jgi:hypothetical protein